MKEDEVEEEDGLFDVLGESDTEEGIQQEIDTAATERLLYDGEGLELDD